MRMTALLFLLSQVLILVAITLLERRHNPGPTDWVRNLQVWLLDIGASFLFLPFFHDWRGASLIDGTALPLIVAFPLFLLIRDGTEFFFHIAQHKVGFLWRMHSLHHSDPEMSAMTTNRHFWGDQVIKAATIWPLTTLVISQSPVMLAGYALVSLYNYFIHANLKVDFGRWSWALNCPAYHRRHHSKLREHYDSNFAPLFPIWDVICGTYRRPDGWPPTGQARAPQSLRDLLSWPVLKPEPSETAEPASEALA
jgi:sterol desaturase/sphingolipid hydroxylase (fatty acid hydroxylase superfamily)